MNLRYIKITGLLTTLLLLLFSCQQEPEITPKDFPYVILNSVDVIPDDGIRVKAEIVHLGKEPVIEKGFVWSLESEFTMSRSSWKLPEAENTKGTFEAWLKNGLLDDTKYYIRAYVKTASQTVYSNTIGFISKGTVQYWIKKGKASFIEQDAAHFTSSSKAYFVAPNTTDLAAYDPVTNQLTIVATLPENSGEAPLATSSGNTGYVLLNTKIYTYNTGTNEWQLLADYPHERVEHEYVFFVNNTLFIGSYTNGKLYGYSIAEDDWDEKAGINQTGGLTNVMKNAPVVLGKAYIITAYPAGNTVFEYDPITDEWKIPFTPEMRMDRGTALFAMGDKLYWGLGSSLVEEWGFVNPLVFSFDPQTEIQQQLLSIPPYGMITIRSFVVNGKVYLFALGGRGSDIIDELWEFNLAME